MADAVYHELQRVELSTAVGNLHELMGGRRERRKWDSGCLSKFLW